MAEVGVVERTRLAVYQLEKDLFIKTIPLIPGATYPDMGCNCEFFTMPGFLEVESLGPLVKLEPNAATEHIEKWWAIPNLDLPSEEKPLIAALNSHLKHFDLPTIN